MPCRSSFLFSSSYLYKSSGWGRGWKVGAVANKFVSRVLYGYMVWYSKYTAFLLQRFVVGANKTTAVTR